MAFGDFKIALNDTSEIKLTTTGRNSGRESSRPVWFVEQGENLYLLPVTGTDSQWYKNVLKTPTIRLAAGHTEYSARAVPVTDPAKVDEVVDSFRAKYGAGDVESYYRSTTSPSKSRRPDPPARIACESLDRGEDQLEDRPVHTPDVPLGETREAWRCRAVASLT